MGARHYDPATGRFLQTDPLGVAAEELYGYAKNNPYVFWDPTGLAPSPVVADDQAFGSESGSPSSSRPLQLAEAPRGGTCFDFGCLDTPRQFAQGMGKFSGGQPFPGSDRGTRPGPDALVHLGLAIFNPAFFTSESQRLDAEIRRMRRIATLNDLFADRDAYVFKEFRYTLGAEGLRVLAGARPTTIETRPIGAPEPLPPALIQTRGSPVEYRYLGPFIISPARTLEEFLRPWGQE